MYQVIARTWRPQRFSEVIGQRHVTQTLQNAIRSSRIGHGYIFSGQRGVGKTTVARLLAKALNCLQGPVPEPCGECDSCREIAAGRSVDVIEIDAASNRGIDAVRELRENARYAPARDRYKVFIIDEAHQITPEGFNALLKTLEEPPAHVIFLLATTEVHQFPETILSRCQHFAFHAVAFPEILAHLEKVCEGEGVAADAEALSALAASGEGSLRDSLSRLEQAIAAFGTPLEGAAVRRLLGAAPAQLVESVFAAVRERKREQMLEVIEKLVQEGYQLTHFCSQLVHTVRNVLVARVAGPQPHLLAASAEEIRRIASLAEQFPEESLMRFLEILLQLNQELRYSMEPRFQMELGLLKLVDAERLVAIEELLARLESGSAPGPAAAGPQLPKPGDTAAAPKLSPFEQDRLRKMQPGQRQGDPQSDSQSDPQSGPKTRSAGSQPSPREEGSVPEGNGPVAAAEGTSPPQQEVVVQEVLRRIEGTKPMLAKMFHSLLTGARRWEFGDTEVTVQLAENGIAKVLPASDRQLLERLLTEVLGRRVRLRWTEEAAAPSPPARRIKQPGEENNGAGLQAPSVEDRVRSDPEIREFEKVFGKPVGGIRRWEG